MDPMRRQPNGWTDHMMARPMTMPIPAQTMNLYGDGYSDSHVEEALLRDLIAPPRRTPLGTKRGESNLVSILARRVIQANQRSIDQRTSKSLDPYSSGAGESRESRDRENHRSRRSDDAHRRDTTTHTPTNSTPSNTRHTTSHSTRRSSAPRVDIARSADRRPDPLDSRRPPTPISASPHTPPTSSLTREDIDMKTNDRATSHFLPNPTNVHTSQPHQHATQPMKPQHAEAIPPPPLEASTTLPPPIISPSVVPPLFSGPGDFPFAPTFSPPLPSLGASLESRAAHELRILDTLQESRASVAALAHQHSLNLLQSETEKLAAALESKERQRRAEEAAQAQARAEFIARTHSIDAARESEKLAALAEAARLRDALHSVQLQAQHQASLLAQEVDRQHARAAQQELASQHQLELERVKREMIIANEANTAKRVAEAAREVREQVKARETQHEAALQLALAQTHANADQFEQLKSLTSNLQDLTRSQSASLKSVAADVAAQVDHAARREEHALDQVAKQQQATVQAIIAATTAATNAATTAATAAATAAATVTATQQKPMQVQLIGLPTTVPLLPMNQLQPAQPSFPSFPQSSPIASSRRGVSAPVLRSRSASISQSAAYSDDFDLSEPPPVQAAALPSARRATNQPTSGLSHGDIDEEYEEDFSAASLPATPMTAKATIRRPAQAAPTYQPTTTPAKSTSYKHRTTASIDESIEFDEGVDVAASAGPAETSFHLAASPIAARSAAAQREEEIDIEIEIDEESHGAYGASASVSHRPDHTASVIEEDFSVSGVCPPVSSLRVGVSAPSKSAAFEHSASQEYSEEDFVNETGTATEYRDESFVTEENQNKKTEKHRQQQLQQPTPYAAQPVMPVEEPTVDYVDSPDPYDGSPPPAPASFPAPDDPSALIASIDNLVAQQLSLLDARYSELTASTKHQLAILHKESQRAGWSEREVERRKLSIKSAFQSSKGAIARDRALVHTMAQQQKLAIYQHHQQLTSTRTDAANWEAKLARIELGPDSRAPTPTQRAKHAHKTIATESGESMEISFEEQKETPAATNKRSSHATRVKQPTAIPSKPHRPIVMSRSPLASGSSSFDSFVGSPSIGVSFDSGSTEEDVGAGSADRDRLLSLQRELHHLRRTRAQQESDPHTMALIRQERRLKATQELAEKILAEKEQVLANANRDARIASRKKEVARLLKAVQQLDRPTGAVSHTDSALDDSLQAATTTRSHHAATRAGRSPRKQSPRTTAPNKIPAHTIPTTTHTTTKENSHDDEEVEIEFSDADASASDNAKAAPTHAVAGESAASLKPAVSSSYVGGDVSDEVAISFSDSDGGGVGAISSLPARPAGPVCLLSGDDDDDALLVSSVSSRPARRSIPSASDIEEQMPNNAQTDSSHTADEVEEEIAHENSGNISAPPEEIETDPEELQQSVSYSESFDDKVEVDEESGAYGGSTHSIAGASVVDAVDRSVDASGDYADDFVAASPTASFANNVRRMTAPITPIDQSIEEESLYATSNNNENDSLHDEADDAVGAMAASAGTNGYDADSFVVSSASIASSHSLHPDAAPAASAAGAHVSTPLDQSIAEENLSVSEQYEESFVAGSAASVDAQSVKSSRSVHESYESIPVGTTSIDGAADASYYSDSFHDSLSPPTHAESALTVADSPSLPPPVADPTATLADADTTLLTHAANSHKAESSYNGELNESCPEEIEQTPSANHSITNEQVEAIEERASLHTSTLSAHEYTTSEFDQTDTSTAAVDVAHSAPVAIAPLLVDDSFDSPSVSAPASDDSIVDDVPGESIEESIIDAAAPVDHSSQVIEAEPSKPVTPTHTNKPNSRARLAELEAHARAQQDSLDSFEHAVDDDSVAADDDRASAAERDRKEELVNSITMRLLQDLSKELQSESASIPRSRKRRAAAAAAAEPEPVTAPPAAAPAPQPPTNATDLPTAEAEVVTQLQAELIQDSVSEVERIAALKRARNAQAADAGNDAATHSPSLVDSPTRLSPTSPIADPSIPINSALRSPISLPHAALLDSPLGLMPASTTNQVYALPALVEEEWALDSGSSAAPVNAHSTDEPLGSAHLSDGSSSSVEPVDVALADEHSIRHSKEFVERLLRDLFDMAMAEPRETQTADETNIMSQTNAMMLPILSDSTLAEIESRQTAANSGSTLESSQPAFNRLILATANQYILSYNTSVSGRELSSLPWFDSDPVVGGAIDEELISLPLSNHRVRRAPGGAILSLKSSRPPPTRAEWQELVIRKVVNKVVRMDASSRALANSVADKKMVASSDDATANLNAAIDIEVALVNAILAREMHSVEASPAGATHKEWKQHRGDNPPPDEFQLDDSASTSASFDAFDSSLLYSGSECDWEGGFEFVESGRIIGEIADSLLTHLIAELVNNAAAIEDRKYMRKLSERAQTREQRENHNANNDGLANQHDNTPYDTQQADERDSTAKKKARRQAIKLYAH